MRPRGRREDEQQRGGNKRGGSLHSPQQGRQSASRLYLLPTSPSGGVSKRRPPRRTLEPQPTIFDRDRRLQHNDADTTAGRWVSCFIDFRHEEATFYTEGRRGDGTTIAATSVIDRKFMFVAPAAATQMRCRAWVATQTKVFACASDHEPLAFVISPRHKSERHYPP